MGEDSTPKQNVSKTMSLILGARRHLELGHEKYMMDTIQSHPAQVMFFFFKYNSIYYFFVWNDHTCFNEEELIRWEYPKTLCPITK